MDFVKEFESHLINEGKGQKTIESYIRDVKLFIKWYAEQTEHGIETLQLFELNDYKKHLEKTTSITTTNRKISSLNQFINWLYTNEAIKEPYHIKSIKDTTPLEFKGLEETDEKRLRKEIYLSKNKMHICLFELLRNTGIRVSELCCIKLSDIKITDKKGSILVHGKGDKYRTISLNKTAREAIVDYLKVRTTVNDDHLLIGQRGAIKRNAVDLILKKYGEKIGINVSAHMLRHSLAYKLVSKPDVAITTIQSVLGHSNLNTVMIYTQTKQADQEKALEDLD